MKSRLLVSALAIASISFSQASATVDNCSVGLGGGARGIIECPEYWTVESDSILFGDSETPPNPDFVRHFTLKTCYDWDDENLAENLWDIGQLREFAWFILNPDPADPDLAVQILEFFAVNTATGDDLIEIDSDDGPHTEFEILVQYDAPELGADESRLSVEIWNPDSSARTPEHVAKAGFAHEWQHICFKYYDKTGARHRSSFSKPIVFNEMCSVFSEWYFGWDGIAGFGGGEVAYDRSLLESDQIHFAFHESCMCADDLGEVSCCPYAYRHPYVQLSLFSIYLHNRFSSANSQHESIIQDWVGIHEPDGLEERYLHDMRGLAEILENSFYDTAFPLEVTSGEDRVRHTLQRYLESTFVDLPMAGQGGELFEWKETNVSEPRRAQDFFNLYRPELEDPYDPCSDDVACAPPYHTIGASTEASFSGFVSYSAVFGGTGCDGDAGTPYWRKRRYIECSTMAANPIVALPATGASGTLRFSLSPMANY